MKPGRPDLPSRKRFLKTAAGAALAVGCAGLGSGCGTTLRDKLSVEPDRVRGDERFVVRLEDLPPGERVTLTAAFDDAAGQEWSATAFFESDDDGNVDTSEQAPVGGAYGVRDPMGLVWSALGPGLYAPALPAPAVRIGASVGDEEAQVRVERYDLAGGASSEDVREDGLVGRLFLPAAADPAPGVLVLGGSEGGLSPYSERQAMLLASRGYAALVLAYFKGEIFRPEDAANLPDTLTNVPLEYFGRALRWLGGRDGVIGDRLGVLGTSRGGELALLLGATHQEISSVVSYVGSGVVVGAPGGDLPAWTRDGEPVPHVDFFGQDYSEIPRDEAERAEIAVENTSGPVLLIAAGDDALWPSEELSRVAHERLGRHDRPHEDELAVYPDAGHLLGAPYLPAGAGVTRFGGTAEANARASEDSWRRATEHLDGSLGR